MARVITEEDKPISAHRVEAYSDGVFAIAATLLVLDLTIDKLRLPSIARATNDQIWTGLLGMSGTFFSFALSFILLGLFWQIHVRQFERVVLVDGPLLWLNILRLLAVVLIPFSTSLDAEFQDVLLGRIVLPVNFFFVTLLGAAQWWYATRAGSGLVTGLSAAGIRGSRLRAAIAALTALVVVALAPILGSYAFILFALNPFLDRVTNRIVGPEAEPATDPEQPGSPG